MLSSFKLEELDYLTKMFSMATNASLDRRCSIKATDLLDEAKCTVYLDWLTSILQSPSRMITASQFSKRYAFLTIAPSLYSMTVYNKGLDLAIENCCIESVYHNEVWISHLCLTELQVNEPAKEKRQEWRDEVIKKIFAGNLAKIWRSISKSANLPMSILWENTAVRVYSFYEKRIGEGTSEQEKSRIQEDFEYLISEAPASLFRATENPLATFYDSKCQPVRIRKTCCFYYKVSSNGDYCSTCPKVKHDRGSGLVK